MGKCYPETSRRYFLVSLRIVFPSLNRGGKEMKGLLPHPVLYPSDWGVLYNHKQAIQFEEIMVKNVAMHLEAK